MSKAEERYYAVEVNPSEPDGRGWAVVWGDPKFVQFYESERGVGDVHTAIIFRDGVTRDEADRLVEQRSGCK